MTIATLLIVAIVYKATGFTGTTGMVAALTVAAIICTALAVSGDVSQDLKTGYIVGGTPWKQQVAMMIGVVASASVIGFILVLMDNAYTMGSAELPAPKAALMKILAEGVLGEIYLGLDLYRCGYFHYIRVFRFEFTCCCSGHLLAGSYKCPNHDRWIYSILR